MRYAECVELLRWALPRLGLRFEGFRRVRRRLIISRLTANRSIDVPAIGIGSFSHVLSGVQ
jgi:hypothetical protein